MTKIARTHDERLREVLSFAHEEMRNRGLEDAARFVERSGVHRQWGEYLARRIRSLKHDPAAQLSDWWAPECRLDVPAGYVPMGA